MLTLSQLRETAQNDPAKRSILLVLANGRKLNARFIDPWLGVLELDELPGKAVYTRDLDEHETVGLFTDPEHECRPETHPGKTETTPS